MKTGKLGPEQIKRVTSALESVPFARLIVIELDEVDSGTATLAFDIRDELKDRKSTRLNSSHVD